MNSPSETPGIYTPYSYRDKETAIAWARTMLCYGCVILDTETTGLDASEHEPIEIGILSSRGEVLLQTYLQPENPIDTGSRAFEVNGITQAMVKDAPKIAELWEEIVERLQGQTVVGYNIAFDRAMLEGAILRHSLIGLNVRQWQDAMKMWARFRGERDTRTGRFRNTPLPEGDHTAIGDCKAILRLIKTMATG